MSDIELPEPFILYTDSKARIASIDNLRNACEELPLESVFRVKIVKGEEARSDLQNRLYQSCKGQAAKQLGMEPDVIGGASKFHYLLPMKFAYAAENNDDDLLEQAELEKLICDAVAEKYQGDVMYRIFDEHIRSKPPVIKTMLFAMYMDKFFQVWGGRGVSFKLLASEKDRALGRSVQR